MDTPFEIGVKVWVKGVHLSDMYAPPPPKKKKKKKKNEESI